MLSIRNDGDKIDYHFPRKTKLKKHLVDVLEENVDERILLPIAPMVRKADTPMQLIKLVIWGVILVNGR